MQSSKEVLARKYRPKNFSELIGQEAISQTLSLALDSNRLSHAYLFSGLRGSGKTSTARIFAKALLCEKGISHEPCEECESCIMARENRHIDIIEMDGASSRKIDDIRELIEQTKYKPSFSRFKIFIIDEVHMLTKEAFNALLKTLEEPPSFVKFILATTDPLKLPATILSRTQHFRFKKIATNKIVSHLRYILELEGIEYQEEALEILARSGNGSLRDTLTLLDQAIIYSKGFVDVATVTDMLGLVDPQFLEQLFDAILAKDRAKIVEYAKILEDYEAEMVVDELIIYLKEHLFNGSGKFSPLLIERFFRILSQSKSLFAINADGGFVLSLVFFKMVEALKVQEIDTLIEQFENNITLTPPSIEKTQFEEPKTQDIHSKEQKTSEKPKTQSKQQLEKKSSSAYEMYNLLVEKIADRNVELGECFEQYISFVSYENDTLVWESCVNEECKKKLKDAYGVIKMLVKDIFGYETKIKGQPCSKEEQQATPKEISSVEESSKTVSDQEEAIGGSSCVATCAGLDDTKTEVDDIMQEEMVQKAMELFEPTKVIVKSKV